MPDESRIRETRPFGLTRRGRLEDLSFTLQNDGRYVHPENGKTDTTIAELNYGHGEGSKSMTNVILKYLPD